jgi:hypothetical protein
MSNLNSTHKAFKFGINRLGGLSLGLQRGLLVGFGVGLSATVLVACGADAPPPPGGAGAAVTTQPTGPTVPTTPVGAAVPPSFVGAAVPPATTPTTVQPTAPVETTMMQPANSAPPGTSATVPETTGTARPMPPMGGQTNPVSPNPTVANPVVPAPVSTTPTTPESDPTPATDPAPAAMGMGNDLIANEKLWIAGTSNGVGVTGSWYDLEDDYTEDVTLTSMDGTVCINETLMLQEDSAEQWGGGMGLNLNDEDPWDGSAYSGFSFTADFDTDNPIQVRVVNKALSGTGKEHYAVVKKGANTVSWASLMQPDWVEETTDFKDDAIISLQFIVVPTESGGATQLCVSGLKIND